MNESSDQLVSLSVLLYASEFVLSNSVIASSIKCRRLRQQCKRQIIIAIIVTHIIANSRLTRISKRILKTFCVGLVVVVGMNNSFVVLTVEILYLDIIVVAVIVVISFNFVVNVVSVVVFRDSISVVSIQLVFVVVSMNVIDVGASTCSVLVDVVLIVVIMDVC